MLSRAWNVTTPCKYINRICLNDNPTIKCYMMKIHQIYTLFKMDLKFLFFQDSKCRIQLIMVIQNFSFIQWSWNTLFDYMHTFLNDYVLMMYNEYFLTLGICILFTMVISVHIFTILDGTGICHNKYHRPMIKTLYFTNW